VFEDRLSYENREKRAAVGAGREVPGEDLGRIISLSDGVFAFALTLLVLGLTVPSVSGGSDVQKSIHLWNALQGDWPKFLGYVFAFLMISIWWMGHHRTFRYIQRYDFVLMWLNMLILLEIAVMPFVLQVYTTDPSAQTAVVLFASLQVVTGLTLNALWRYASAGHRLIDPKLPAEEIRYFANRGVLPAAVFLASIGISFLSVSWAEYFWVTALVVGRFARRYGVA
jgi:uncharacterized membrane protein